jgi:ectoine hydroxylase-related dioxygenase (phytanoyl-CoA dioxygenase family)
MIQMHNWDKASGEWANDANVLGMLQQLLAGEPVLNQTMLYFKPPGARGQAHHQDQQYITLDPLIGVWVALDPSDEGTGQMMLVPGSHRLGLQPVEPADTKASFTGGKTVLPEGVEEVGADMQPGDVLFFDGKTIHGSYPNTTTDRWRRSFICHYVADYSVPFVPGEGQHMAHLGKNIPNLK